MKLSIKAKTDSREAYVKKIDEKTYEVAVKDPKTEGRANRAIIAALAEYFDISRSRISIMLGRTSHIKVVEIL